MTKPKFTDTHKWQRAYKPSHDTDITKTWEAARKRLEADKAERADKVREIKQIGVKK